MNKKAFLQIGHLAKICGVSEQALRYYEKIHLVKPAYIDELTGYRYYSPEDVFRVRNIVMLKSAGFTLKEIAIFLKKKSIHEIEQLYNEKMQFFEEQMNSIQVRKEKISCYLDYLTSLKSTSMQYEKSDIGKILEGEMETEFVVYIRDTIVFDYPSLMFLYNQLLQKVFENNLRVDKSLFSIFHSEYENLYHKNCDIELNLVITQGVPMEKDGIKKRNATKVLSCLHRGKYPSCVPVYHQILHYAKSKGYQINGAPIHKLIVPLAAVNSSSEIVFEILQPVV